MSAAVYPSTLPPENLANSTGFAPDETPEPQGPEAPGKWDVFMKRLEFSSMDQGFGFPGVAEGPMLRSIEGGDAMAGGVPSAFALAKGGVDEWYEGARKTKISPEEANAQYPGLEKPFSEPVYRETADLIARTQKRRKELQDWIAGAPDLGMGYDALIGGVAGGLGGITGGLGGMAAGAAIGAGFGAAFGGEGVVAGAANPLSLELGVAASAVAGPASKTLYGYLSRFAQNLAVNVGTVVADIPQLNKEKDVSLKEEAIGVVGSAIGGTAAHGALEFGFSKLAARVNERHQQKLAVAIMQHENGASVAAEVIPEQEGVSTPSASGARDATDRSLSPENSRLYEPGLDERIAESQKPRETTPEAETTEAKQTFTNHMAFLDEVGKLDPSLLTDPAFKELQHMAAQGKQEGAVLKAFADCMTGVTVGALE